MNNIKTDKEYNYNVVLTDNRELPEGHDIFDFSDKHTEVEVISEIMNKFMDTSSIESARRIPSQKIDFSISVLDTMILIATKKLAEITKYYEDIELQLADLSHRVIKPKIIGENMTKEEKLNIYDIYEDLLISRRELKDAMSMLKILIENTEKTRNFNLSMNQRMYRPKSDRFKDNPNFYMDKVANISRGKHPVENNSGDNTMLDTNHPIRCISSVK